MPGMDGWEVLSKLKADPELAHIPVIMLTMTEDKEIGYSLGAAEYLTKPITRSQLIKVLRKYRSDKNICVVMVVEDDPTTREMMVRMLHKAGMQVIEAENGEVALQRLQKHLPDLILLDLMMPQMDGFEVCQRLRADASLADVPIVMITALEDRHSRLRGIELGADDFISKPFDTFELRARLQNIIQINRYRRLVTEHAKFKWVVGQANEGFFNTQSP